LDKRTLALTVITYWWNNWCKAFGPKYVKKIHEDLYSKNTVPLDFYCFTDQPKKIKNIPRIEFKPRFRWNLNKFECFDPKYKLQGRVLIIDLDTLILKNIDDVLEFKEEFITCSGTKKTDKAGGSITGTTIEYGQKNIWGPLSEKTKQITSKTRGSERFFYRQYIKDMEFFQKNYPGIYNYKTEGIPNDARIIRFHGKPRPHEKGFI
jgi:hypothetical protein